jgi:hypothetical protein
MTRLLVVRFHFEGCESEVGVRVPNAIVEANSWRADHWIEVEAVRNLSRPTNDQESEEFESAAKWLKEHTAATIRQLGGSRVDNEICC